MSAERKAHIRDRRKPGWFRVDDELIEDFGPTIGVHGIAVYAALCKHANGNEECHPGLRRLCEKLKIGRKKLLDTLALLEHVGLISIEPGDRKTVNVYTLLDVPKRGGSDENQVVPDRTRGGSEQHQGGGSDENRNQTQEEPNPSNQVVDDTTTTCLKILLSVPNFPRGQADNALKLAEYRAEFPAVDPVEVCRDFKAWHEEHRQKAPTRLRLRNFFKQASRPHTNGHRKAKPVSGKQAQARREEDYEWLFR